MLCPQEQHHNMLQYQLGPDIKLSQLFGQIETVRERLNIEDYSVSQTTLDQVRVYAVWLLQSDHIKPMSLKLSQDVDHDYN